MGNDLPPVHEINLAAMTSRRFRSPPVCSHDGRLKLSSVLSLLFFPPSVIARSAASGTRRYCRGLRASGLRSASGRWRRSTNGCVCFSVSAAGRAG